LKKFEETPEKTIYIGDDPLKDVETPKKLGIKMILFVPPKKYQKPLPWRRYDIKPKVKPDLRIKKLAELKKIF
jgi:FMN phosphatase YigB (HAD superfamily)